MKWQSASSGSSDSFSDRVVRKANGSYLLIMTTQERFLAFCVSYASATRPHNGAVLECIICMCLTDLVCVQMPLLCAALKIISGDFPDIQRCARRWLVCECIYDIHTLHCSKRMFCYIHMHVHVHVHTVTITCTLHSPLQVLPLSHGLRGIVEGPELSHQISWVEGSIDGQGLGDDQQGLSKPCHGELLTWRLERQQGKQTLKKALFDHNTLKDSES